MGDTSGRKPGAKPPVDAKFRRDNRLKAALKANMARRKTQAKERASGMEDSGLEEQGCAAPDEDEKPPLAG